VPEVESQKKPNPKRSTAAMIPVISTLITGSVITTFIVAFRVISFAFIIQIYWFYMKKNID